MESETLDIAKDLWARGIRLTADGDRLRCAAPSGVMNPQLQDVLRTHKDRLLAALQRETHESLSKRRASIKKVDRSKSYALSFAQRRIWMIHRMGVGSIAYHFTGKMVVEGEFDLEAWRTGWRLLVERHEALRTSFFEEDGEPRQRIVESAASEIPLVDVTELSSAEQEKALEHIVTTQSIQPFDLSQAPLTRQCVVQRNSKSFVFVITIHHIISDGWSVGNMLRDLLLHYRKMVLHEAVQFPELKAQHLDYSEWQNSQLNHGEMERQLEYWRQQLAGAPPLLVLPTDRPRPPVERYVGRSIDLSLGLQRTAAVRRLCKERAVTPFMVMVAGLNVLLHIYSGQDDIAVGTVVANRQHEEAENLMGIFINTLVLRSRIKGTQTFLDHLAQVRDTALEAFANQDLPFERLVEAVKPERSPSYNPLFQVMLLMQNTPMPSIRLPGFRIEVGEVSSTTAPFDLTFTLAESECDISGSLKYNTDLFDESTIRKMADRFCRVLDSLIRAPGIRLDKVTIDEADAFAPRTLSLHPRACLHELFEGVAATAPDRIALVEDGHHWTYAAVNARANRLARLLRRSGLTLETTVGLYMRRSCDVIVAMLAICKAGGTYVPIDPAYPESRISYILQKSRAPLLLTDNFTRGRLVVDGCTELCMADSEEALRRENTGNLGLWVNPENLAYVIFTSGSTGRPKGVAITHQNVTRLLKSAEQQFRFLDSDAWTFFHSAAFDFSVWEIWAPLAAGARIVVVDYETSRDPQKFWRLLVDQRVTIVNQTPTAFSLWSTLATEPSARTHSLRYVIFGGEELKLSMLESWFRALGDECTHMINMYGITETTVHVTFRRIRAEDLSGNSQRSFIGEPLNDLDIRLVNSAGHLVPTGIDGEIHVLGAGLARGYVNDPRETARRFVPNFVNPSANTTRLYRSGDLARKLSNSDTIYLGRIDTQVKIRGFRIELREIERVITSVPGVVNAAAVVLEKDTAAEYIAAYYVAGPGAIVSVDVIREAARRLLPEYMIPRFILPLEVIPVTGNGKLDTARLPKPTGAATIATATHIPANDKERRLAAIWRQLLEIQEVGVEDNFFQIGGHSIIALKMLNTVQQEFKCQLSFEAFFRHATIRGLAKLVPAESDGNADETLASYAKHSGSI